MRAAIFGPSSRPARQAKRAGRASRTARQPRGDFGLSIFPSALGWMAMLGRDETLLRLTFGHASGDEALVALRADEGWQAGLSQVSSTHWHPALAGRLQAYAKGKADDFL